MNASISTRPARSATSKARRDGVGVAAHRLLAEDVLSGFERADRPLDVQRVRQRDVDRVDVRVGEELVVASPPALEPVLGGVRLRARAVAARGADDRDELGLGGAVDDRVVDLRGREQCEPEHGHIITAPVGSAPMQQLQTRPLDVDCARTRRGPSDEGDPEGWDRVVRSYAYDSGACLVLFDPLAPPSLLEGLVESKDVAVLLTEECHVREHGRLRRALRRDRARDEGSRA